MTINEHPAAAPTELSADITYDAAVREGRKIVANMSGKQWALGDLAAQVEKVYGENRLAQFAEDINFPGEPSTLARHRSVCLAFPKTGGRPRHFASAQVLATHPNRIAIVTENPDISKAEARRLMGEWSAEQPDGNQAGAKGAKKTANDANEWSGDNRQWEREVLLIANNAVRVAAFLKQCTPEQRRQVVEDVEPSLGAQVRRVSEAWRELADALDEPLEKEAETLIQNSRVKTTPRASRPAQASA
jgi:hypothetical protein